MVGADNGHLRLALFRAWKRQCYLCEQKKTFSVIEIDHILPHSTTTEKASDIWDRVAAPEPFLGLHDVGNLAPICRRCNGRSNKGAKVLADGLLAVKIAHALDKVSDVAKEMRKLISGTQLEEALSNVALADPRNTLDRKILGAGARDVLETFVSAGAVLEYTSLHQLLPRRMNEPVELSMDQKSRNIESSLSLVWNQSLKQIVSESVPDAWEEGLRAIYRYFEGRDAYGSSTTAGDPTVDWANLTCTVDGFDVEGLSYTLSGELAYEVSGQVEITTQALDGDGITDDSAFFDATGVASYHIYYRADSASESDSDSDNVTVEAFHKHVQIDDWGWSDKLQG